MIFFLQHFGEITKHEVDRSAPQLTISYATRLNAEQAVLRGRVFKEKRLQVCRFSILVFTFAIIELKKLIHLNSHRLLGHLHKTKWTTQLPIRRPTKCRPNQSRTIVSRTKRRRRMPSRRIGPGVVDTATPRTDQLTQCYLDT